MVLTKKFTRIGNSVGMIFPIDLLKMAGMEPQDECDIEAKKNLLQLRLHPKRNKKDEKVIKAMARFINKYRDDLKKLA